jgi:hypothetical protein
MPRSPRAAGKSCDTIERDRRSTAHVTVRPRMCRSARAGLERGAHSWQARLQKRARRARRSAQPSRLPPRVRAALDRTAAAHATIDAMIGGVETDDVELRGSL